MYSPLGTPFCFPSPDFFFTWFDLSTRMSCFFRSLLGLLAASLLSNQGALAMKFLAPPPPLLPFRNPCRLPFRYLSAIRYEAKTGSRATGLTLSFSPLLVSTNGRYEVFALSPTHPRSGRFFTFPRQWTGAPLPFFPCF